MRILIACMTAAMLAGGALAQTPTERWVVVGMKGGATGWESLNMEKDTAKNTVTLTRFTYFATPKPFGDTGYSYMFQDITFACGQSRFQLGEAFITDLGGTVLGKGSTETTWRDLAANSPEGLLEGIACRGNDVLNAKTFEDSDLAMAGAVALALP